jgi:hypothetical protein
MNKMIEQNKYLFEEYDDYNDCEQCGGGSSTCYIISLSENADEYLFSTGSLYASCYDNERPSLSLLHEYCINDLKFNFNIENFDINKICSLSELVSLYEKENNNVKYEYQEHENYDYYDDDDYDYDYDGDYDDDYDDDTDDDEMTMKTNNFIKKENPRILFFNMYIF